MKIVGDLTTKQSAILKFLQNKITDEGRPPTIREIGEHFGFKSTGTTRDYLSNLSKKGYIKLGRHRSRSISLSKPLTFRIPVLGSIMAGMPELALEEIEENLSLDDLLPSRDREIFALRIKGNSMIEKGISEGDLAIVKRQRLAQAGDIVAALIENEATIKVLKKQNADFFLAPAHKDYPEIHKPFEILGKVIAVIKRFD